MMHGRGATQWTSTANARQVGEQARAKNVARRTPRRWQNREIRHRVARRQPKPRRSKKLRATAPQQAAANERVTRPI